MHLTQVIKLDCPHCDIRKAAFTLKGQHNYSGEQNPTTKARPNCSTVLYICPDCNEGIVASAVNGEIWNLYPNSEINIPEDLPPAVARYFEQGVDCLRGNYDAAGMMFRKSLEVGLGVKFPDSKGGLAERIKGLAKNASLTQDLAEWADHIRLEGNDAAHDQFTKAQAEELHSFTNLVLTYLFTLPEIAKKADAARQAKKGNDIAQAKK